MISFCLFKKASHWVQFMRLMYMWIWAIGAWVIYQWPPLKEEWLSLPQQPSTVNSSLAGDRSPSPLHTGVLLGLILFSSCAGSQSCRVVSVTAISCPADKVSQHRGCAPHPLLLPFLLFPPSTVFPEPQGKRWIYNVPFEAGCLQSLIFRTWSSHESLHWSTSVHCIEKLLWAELRGPWLYESKYSEESWTMWLLGKITTVDSYLEPMTFGQMDSIMFCSDAYLLFQAYVHILA